MGRDSKLYLPPTAKMRDVADVLGILTGAKPERYTIDRADDAVFVRVPDAPKFQPSGHSPEMAVLSNGGFWHWETEDAPFPGARLFTCSTQDHRRPVLEALCDVFGGVLDFNDCDGTDVDYIATGYGKPYHTDATNGADWDTWQLFKLQLKPVGRW